MSNDAIRQLVVGLWTRQHAVTQADGDYSPDELKGYIDAAHVALPALGCPVPPAPFGLRVIISEAVQNVGPRPSKSSPSMLMHWRKSLTDDIIARLGALS